MLLFHPLPEIVVDSMWKDSTRVSAKDEVDVSIIIQFSLPEITKTNMNESEPDDPNIDNVWLFWILNARNLFVTKAAIIWDLSETKRFEDEKSNEYPIKVRLNKLIAIYQHVTHNCDKHCRLSMCLYQHYF